MELSFESLASIAALIVAIGSAFFTAGVTMQQLQQVEKRQDKTDERLDLIEKNNSEAAASRAALGAKMDAMSGQLDRVLDHLQPADRKD